MEDSTVPRAIRNTIECTLREKWRSLRSFLSSDSHASMKSELGKLRVNCKLKIEPDIDS